MASLWTKFTDIFSRNKSGVVPQAPSGTGTTKYLREDGTWAEPHGAGGSSTLDGLEDVDISDPESGQGLVYNEETEKWENGDVASDMEEITYEYYLAHKAEIEASNRPYIVSGDSEAILDAIDVIYDNSNSGLESQTVQGAIDEIIQNRVNRDTAFVCGEIWKSNNDQIKGYGGATLTFFNGIVRIDFAVRITTKGASSSDFTHGISVDAIRALLPNAPNITPIKGGYWDNGNKSGVTSQMGYYPTFALQNSTSRYWTPGRIHSASSDEIGLWGAATFTRDMFIYGTCFGTYT